MNESTKNQAPEATSAPITQKSPNLYARLVLEVLDRNYFRDGRAVEYDDPLSNGLVRIQKEENGRVHFRTPRVPAKSIRLRPSKGLLLFKNNVTILKNFLDDNPLILSFLDENQLRAARR